MLAVAVVAPALGACSGEEPTTTTATEPTGNAPTNPSGTDGSNASEPTTIETAIPFDRMGAGWMLVLSNDRGAHVLRVLAPDGAAYAVPGGGRSTGYRSTQIDAITDWRPDGREATVRTDEGRLGRVSLADGSFTPFPADVVDAGYTRPDGEDLVVAVRQGTEQWIELRDGDAVALERSSASPFGLPWLYGADGTKVLVGDAFAVGALGGHLTLHSNDGRRLHLLDSADGPCTPRRWWVADAALSACNPRSGGSYQRLWLAPIDGGTASALTPGADAAVAGAELGFSDAQPLQGAEVVVQGESANGPRLFRRAADGVITPLTGAAEGSARLVGTTGGRIVLWRPGNRAAGVDALLSVRFDGSDPVTLLDGARTGQLLDVVALEPPVAVSDPEFRALRQTTTYADLARRRVCPVADTDHIPDSLDRDRDGLPEKLTFIDVVRPVQPITAVLTEVNGEGELARAPIPEALDPLNPIVPRTAWYGDLDADGQSEVVGCALTASGSGYPFTVLVVLRPDGAGWTTAFAELVSGAALELDATTTGLTGVFRQRYVAATCIEDTRRTWTLVNGTLVSTGADVVSRTKTSPGGPCPWE